MDSFGYQVDCYDEAKNNQ